MHVSASRWSIAAVLSWAALAPCAAPPSGHPAGPVRAALDRACAGCHGTQAKPKGGLGHITDLARLVSQGQVVAGHPELSPLFARVLDGEMPPPPKAHTFTAADRELLRAWIAAGAPVPAVAARVVSAADLDRLIRADLDAHTPAQRRFLRYLTLHGDRGTLRDAVAKLVNSLSWHARLSVPQPVADGLALRLDLRHYRWTARQWDRLAARYPYAPAEGDRVILRADWFVANASRPPAYHDFLTLPASDRALERLLQVDVATNIEEQTAVRAGFNGSGVARANRVLERHDGPHGAYWRSYDFGDNTGRGNLFEFPLGPAPGPAGFRHAGGEIIFHLPNGLQAYLLVDADGRRVDKAPGEIVSDPKRPDRLVENGVSCMGCHVTGILPKDDQVREHVRKNAGAFAAEVRDEILALYPQPRRLQAVVKEDNARFAAAMKQLGVAMGEPEPVITAVLRYEEVVDLPRAAEELGVTSEELTRQLRRSPELSRTLGPLLAKGSVQRQVFEEVYVRLLPGATTAPVVAVGPLGEHRRAVTALALDARGQWAASGDAGGTVRLRDLATGRDREWAAHVGEVHGLAFSSEQSGWPGVSPRSPGSALTGVSKTPPRPPVERLVSVGADRVVQVWDATGTRLHRLTGHTAAVRCVAAHGSLAVTAGEDRTVRVWDIDKGTERRALAGHTGTVHAVAVSPDGKFVLSGSADRTARLWRAETGDLVARFDHAGEVRAVAFSPDGKLLAAAGRDVTIHDAAGKVVHRFADLPGPPLAVAFADRTVYVSLATDADTALRRLDLATGRQAAVTGKARADCAAVNARGQVLVGMDRAVHLAEFPRPAR